MLVAMAPYHTVGYSLRSWHETLRQFYVSGLHEDIDSPDQSLAPQHRVYCKCIDVHVVNVCYMHATARMLCVVHTR